MRVDGIPASAGYAEGPLFDLDQPPAGYEAKAGAAEEKAALEAAIGKAVGRLAALIETADGDSPSHGRRFRPCRDHEGQ